MRKLCSFAELVQLNLFSQLVVLGEGLAAVLKVLPHQFITEPAVRGGASSVNGRRGGKSKLIIYDLFILFFHHGVKRADANISRARAVSMM